MPIDEFVCRQSKDIVSAGCSVQEKQAGYPSGDVTSVLNPNAVAAIWPNGVTLCTVMNA
jgi:hypothetical protein